MPSATLILEDSFQSVVRCRIVDVWNVDVVGAEIVHVDVFVRLNAGDLPEGGKEGRKEGRKEAGKKGSREGRKKAGKAGRKQGSQEGRKEDTCFIIKNI